MTVKVNKDEFLGKDLTLLNKKVRIISKRLDKLEKLMREDITYIKDSMNITNRLLRDCVVEEKLTISKLDYCIWGLGCVLAFMGLSSLYVFVSGSL